MWRVLVLGCVAACYHPTVAGDVPCSADGTCPDGQVCDMSRSPPTCVAQLGDGSVGSADRPQSNACSKDSDCASHACSESTSTCIAASAALYVAPAGSDGNDCSYATPCATVSFALTKASASRAFVRVADGTYADSWVTNTSYVVSGEGNTRYGARIDFTAGPDVHDHVVEVTGGTVVIEGVTLAGATNEAVRAQGSNTKLTLWRCQIQDSGNGNVDINNANVTLYQAHVYAGKGVEAAINATGGTVTIQMSKLDHNDGGGIHLSGGAKFDISNTFIVANGGNGAFVQAAGLGTPHNLAFLTIADNIATSGSGAGATCNVALAFESSIFANNGVTQFGATCSADYSLFTDALPANGGNNDVGSPGFVGGGDYHLTDQSLDAIDKADPAATITTDYDGDLRPHGAASDRGADEH